MRSSTRAICSRRSTPATIRLAVDAAKARIDTQDATIARIGRQIDAQGAVIAQAEAQVGAPRAQYESAEADAAARGARIRSRRGNWRRRTSARSSDSSRRPPTRRAPPPPFPPRRPRKPRPKPRSTALTPISTCCRRRRSRPSTPAPNSSTSSSKAERDLSFTRIRRAIRRRRSATRRSNSGNIVSAGHAPAGRWCRSTASMSTPISRRPNSPSSSPGRRSMSPSTPRRQGRSRRGDVDRARLGRAVLAAAARQRHRQFHQGRAARRGPHRLRARGGPKDTPLRPGPFRRRDRAYPRRDAPKPTLLGALGLWASRRRARGRERRPRRERRRRARRGPHGAGGASSRSTSASSRPSSSWCSGCSWRSWTSRSSRPRCRQIQAGLSASSGRGHLGADELSRRRSHHDPAVGLPVARVFDAHHLHDLRRRLHAMSLMCSTANSIDDMIVWRALQGFIGGGMIPTVFASAYTIFPALQAADRLADHRPRRDARADDRPDDRGLSDRLVLLALAVPGQHPRRASSSPSRPGLLIDFDKPDWSLADHASTGPACSRWRDFSARWNMRSRKARRRTGLRASRSPLAIVVSAVERGRSSSGAPSPRRSRSSISAPFRDRNFWTGSLFSLRAWASASTASPTSIPSISRSCAATRPLMIGETMFVTGACMFITAPISGRLMTNGRSAAHDRRSASSASPSAPIASNVTVGLGFLRIAGAAGVPRRLV